MLAWKKRSLLAALLLVFCGGFLYLAAGPGIAGSEEGGERPDAAKELCVLMTRAGQEAFERRKYSEAMSYFKKALQADSGSDAAWSWYNVAVGYALAEQSQALLYPEVPPPTAAGAGSPGPAPAPAVQAPSTAPKPKFKFKMMKGAEDC